MNLVLTISIGEDYNRIKEYTHPSIKSYAKRIGAKFISIESQKISKTTPHWEKFQISELLNKYNRILYIDTDTIIRNDCPNLFEEVSENELGIFEEGQFTERGKDLMIDTCNGYNVQIPNWNGKYYNTGVMVISQKHKYLFKKPEKEIANFYEQTYLNMLIARDSVKMKDLHYRFNRMICVDNFTGEDRKNSYIIHYAGGLYLFTIDKLIELIKTDLERWEKREYKTNIKHIYISVTGGLGDQICAEPAIRYLRKNLYPTDEIVIGTHFPRIFKHLEKLGVKVYAQGNIKLQDDTPYYICDTLPGPDKLQWRIVSHLLCHSTDYSSMALMKRTIPLKDKQIQFEINKEDYSELYKISGKSNFKNSIVIHPGKHWETKTFPSSYWQEIINELAKKRQIVIIGKEEAGDPPDYIAGARGTVKINCPEGVLDLRNKLNLGELGALLSEAKVLISNDSAPIHFAGAFDNWIVLLPSCKHPDYILPHRNRSIFYKTKSFYKKLIIDEVESRPTQVYPTTVDIKINNWNKYLESPKKIIKEILKLN